ncbi:sugar ABC transporter ATP-binding protein [Promicromonospora citrea]|uniref:Sugar ABC transporter ATP-binding protein n=1 Tax=Promicromonospora citrea TaxID=43677 RepID=A0A8H9GKH8_9MICO|nr:sugar ABC transporter ATP-binding protein [Promicromonospora citrea]NNH51875.1 sugar ABC transporter ATP-binding protein [Promicromonospora citrea]GGM33220.1 sugar ABC transporter ATP-binding protein [Promicromonospora citrea]
MTQQTPPPVVELTGVTVEFPPVKALDGVDLHLRPGEIHALMGENGAGKSTLIKALTGVHTPTEGTVVVDGVERRFSGPADARAHGVSTVYQEVNLCENLTVAENIMLGAEPRVLGGLHWRAMRRQAATHLRRMGLDIDPASSLGSHSLAVQQLVAICRATVGDCKVLILDEPTSSLDTDEVEHLFTVMRSLRDDGVAILFVSHFLDQVYEVSDRMTVLRNGRLVGEYVTADLPAAELVQHMIGRSMDVLEAAEEVAERTERPAGATPLLQVLGLGRKGSIQPFDLDLYEGEVVGLAGLLGSGRTELARLLTGADRADTGQARVAGRPTRLRNPRTAMGHGIAYTSEDRKGEGVVDGLTVRENIVLALQAERGWMRPLPRRQVDEIVARYIEQLGIRPADPEALLRNLSGGNQQKVLLARWLATAPRLLVLDEPTRGIDVGAKAEIQKLVADLAAGGMSVVFISAELEEVLRLSHRIAVLRDRRKVAEIDGEGASTAQVVDLIAGGGAA